MTIMIAMCSTMNGMTITMTITMTMKSMGMSTTSSMSMSMRMRLRRKAMAITPRMRHKTHAITAPPTAVATGTAIDVAMIAVDATTTTTMKTVANSNHLATHHRHHRVAITTTMNDVVHAIVIPMRMMASTRRRMIRAIMRRPTIVRCNSTTPGNKTRTMPVAAVAVAAPAEVVHHEVQTRTVLVAINRVRERDTVMHVTTTNDIELTFDPI
mmetsp:Transcript_52399/g.86735  ORF Transcript_52399/g.86735 Transcript_52399/m.86735 type:complete len:212 (-) Transcript_52399:167-802(-)